MLVVFLQDRTENSDDSSCFKVSLRVIYKMFIAMYRLQIDNNNNRYVYS